MNQREQYAQKLEAYIEALKGLKYDISQYEVLCKLNKLTIDVNLKK